MNTVGFTTAEIKARNKRAHEIVAAHDAHPKGVQRAQARIEKDTRINHRVEPQAERSVRWAHEQGQRADDFRPVAIW